MNPGLPANAPAPKRRGKDGKRWGGGGGEGSLPLFTEAGLEQPVKIDRSGKMTRAGSQRQAGFGPGPQQTGTCPPSRLVLGEATAEGKTGNGQGGARPAPGSDPVRGKSIID